MRHILEILIIFLFVFLLSACRKEKQIPPVISTTKVTEISYTTAISGGKVTNEGGTPVLSKGICWSVNAEPTMADNKTTEEIKTKEFSSTITQLNPDTKYYARAYASNIAGIGYGNVVSFLTKKTGIPILTTTAISSITGSSAISGGNISDDSGSLVTENGICWGTESNPTTDNNKLYYGAGLGLFVSTLNGLKPGTKYFVRAYATNNVGIAYGNEITFTTNSILSVLTTSLIFNITSMSAQTGGDISDNGGAAITERGICWSISQNPGISDNKLISGSGTGVFTSLISGLTGNTKYFVKAYSINSAGIAYGNEISFTTNPPILPLLSTTDVSSVTISSAVSGGAITNDGGSVITSRGICWNIVRDPTIADNKTINGSGRESFISNITGLEPNSLYYLRAYATNGVGTAYGNELIVRTYFGTVSDIDGNIYYTIKIGTQTWMADNLKTTKYNNGDLIGTTIPPDWDISAEITPKYQWAYGGVEANAAVYGRLYTWFTATDSRKVCPSNWHLASDNEWTTMENYLIDNGYNYDGTTTHYIYDKIGKSLAGTKLWKLIGTQGSVGNFDYPDYRNKSGFTALPGGTRTNNGVFFDIGVVAYWWTGTEGSGTFAWVRNLYYSNTNINRIGNQKTDLALSLRCIADY
jgi:uncharacterized protein (TIGR02145 family)